MRARRSALALVALALALAVPQAALAQQMTSDDAVIEALEANPSLRASVLASRSAGRLVLEQEALYNFVLQFDTNVTVGNTPALSTRPTIVYPYTEQVDIGAQLTRALPWGMSVQARLDASRIFSRRFFVPMSGGTGGLIEVGPGYGLGLQLTVTQSFLRGFGETIGLAPLYQARADRVGVDRDRDRAASTLVRDVLVAYWELWYAERAAGTERASRELSARLLDEGTRRAELGALAPADTLALQTQVASSAARIAVADLAVQNAQTSLATLLGRRHGALPLTSDDPSELDPIGVSDVVAAAVESAPEVILADAQIESARVTARTAGEALRPVLDAAATLTIAGLGYDDLGQTFSSFGNFSAVQFLATLTYVTPLDDTQRHMREEQALIAVQIAEQNAEAARAAAAADALAALNADRSATERVGLTETAVDLARRTLAAEEARLALGTGLVINVVVATQAARQAELDHARAIADAQEARTRLLHLIGELVADWSGSVPE